MDMLMEHVRSHAMAYAGVAACVVPLLVLFRKQVMPVLAYAVELAFYFAAFHYVLLGVVRLVRWFKIESTTYVQEKIDPGWQTPPVEFWNMDQYKPLWLFYFEVAFVVLILFLVWRFRPFKAQALKPRTPPPRKGLAPSVRPPAQHRSGAR